MLTKSVKIGDVVVTVAQVREAEKKAKRLGTRVPGLYAKARDLMGPDPERTLPAAPPAPAKPLPRRLSRFNGKGQRRYQDG